MTIPGGVHSQGLFLGASGYMWRTMCLLKFGSRTRSGLWTGLWLEFVHDSVNSLDTNINKRARHTRLLRWCNTDFKAPMVAVDISHPDR